MFRGVNISPSASILKKPVTGGWSLLNNKDSKVMAIKLRPGNKSKKLKKIRKKRTINLSNPGTLFIKNNSRLR